MVTEFPERGQQAPQYWDVQLQAYIDEQAAGAVTPEKVAATLDQEPVAADLRATIARIVAWAKNPDTIITGTITRNGANVITSAAVVWPDGATGIFTTDTIGTLNTIDAYHVTYDDGEIELTFTQPAISRNASGAATNVPTMVVS